MDELEEKKLRECIVLMTARLDVQSQRLDFVENKLIETRLAINKILIALKNYANKK